MEIIGLLIIVGGILFFVFRNHRQSSSQKDIRDLQISRELQNRELSSRYDTSQPRGYVQNAQCFDPVTRKFFDGRDTANIIVLDIETNGLSSRFSVLSCSAIKLNVSLLNCTFNELDRFDRYYYPIEPFEAKAIAINGLTKEEISRRRGGATYPMHFTHDKDFDRFCGDVHGFVCHNTDFESRFVAQMGQCRKFCTMKTNTGVVKTRYLSWKEDYKWPTLEETAQHYEIHVDRDRLHNSMVDVEITASIFHKMLKNGTP